MIETINNYAQKYVPDNYFDLASQIAKVSDQRTLTGLFSDNILISKNFDLSTSHQVVIAKAHDPEDYFYYFTKCQSKYPDQNATCIAIPKLKGISVSIFKFQIVFVIFKFINSNFEIYFSKFLLTTTTVYEIYFRRS